MFVKMYINISEIKDFRQYMPKALPRPIFIALNVSAYAKCERSEHLGKQSATRFPHKPCYIQFRRLSIDCQTAYFKYMYAIMHEHEKEDQQIIVLGAKDIIHSIPGLLGIDVIGYI